MLSTSNKQTQISLSPFSLTLHIPPGPAESSAYPRLSQLCTRGGLGSMKEREQIVLAFKASSWKRHITFP